MDEDSELSSLSSLSPPPESPSPRSRSLSSSVDLGLDGWVSPVIRHSPTPPPRSPTPPHEYVLADNPDIAFLVMFRSRFDNAFSSKVAHIGPQDIERGVVDSVPSPQIEGLLCALLALVLNRKKPVERGHYGRALEEAIVAQKSQWPSAWNGQNPLSGSRTFISMNPSEKLTLLKTLAVWALHSSESVSSMIKEMYKQARVEGDWNQPLAVQPWGADGKDRVFWLIEGKDDTSFRVYSERRRRGVRDRWISVAGSIDDLRALAAELQEIGTQASGRLADRITNAIPRFEMTEEKRKRREYRVARRAQFARPEPGFSLYEGRTRGKRMRYTFEEEEDDDTSDAISTRRSARHSGVDTPAEPTVTASGRQVRTRVGARYGEETQGGRDSADRATPMTGDYEGSPQPEEPPAEDGNPVTYYKPKGRGWKGWAIAEDTGESEGNIHGYNAVDAMDEDEVDASSSGESAGDWDGGDDDSDIIRARDADDEEEDESEDASDDDSATGHKSLVVTLRYGKKPTVDHTPITPQEAAPALGESIPQPQHTAPQTQYATPFGSFGSRPSDLNVQPETKNDPVMELAVSTIQSSNTTVPATMLTPPEPKAQPPNNATTVLPAPSPTTSAATIPKVQDTRWTPATTPMTSEPPTQPNPSVALPTHPAAQALTNGSAPPSQYRQQTLDGLFARASPAVGGDSSNKPLPGTSPKPSFNPTS